MPTVYIPTPMRKLTNNRTTLQSPSGTVTEVLAALEEQAPGLGGQLYTPEGRIKPYVAVFVNDTNIQWLQGEQTAVGERDTVFLVTAMAGG